MVALAKMKKNKKVVEPEAVVEAEEDSSSEIAETVEVKVNPK